MSSNDELLVRYTSLGAALSLLRHQKFTLTDPLLWEDQNDAFSINEYKRKREAKSVLALCFTQAAETFHHWKVFTNRADGVRIEFDHDLVVDWLSNLKTIDAQKVKYREIDRFKHYKTSINDLPFLKRFPYRDEKEFRFVYVDYENTIDEKDFDMDLSFVRRVILNPWMSEDVVEKVRARIQLVDGCKNMDVYRTTVLNNDHWKSLVSAIAES